MAASNVAVERLERGYGEVRWSKAESDVATRTLGHRNSELIGVKVKLIRLGLRFRAA